MNPAFSAPSFWGVRAPASLKLWRLLSFGNSDVHFLGRSRPSLIEAGARRSRPTGTWRAFWGVRAPASLKQDAGDLFARPPDPFWGVRAPASLKRRCRGGGRDLEPPAFWGVRAPASLKPKTITDADLVAAPFWGVRAPASLKHRSCEDRRIQEAGLSGAFAPQPH